MSNEPDKIIYSMIRVSKRHGQREVLKDISLSYFYGAKIGVLGLNGSGKSSLLKILAGVDQSFEGKTVLAPGYTIGYLEQEPLVNEMRTVREVVEEGAQELVNLVKEFEEIIGNRIKEQIDVEYVFQELDDLPEGFEVPEGRTKPWGTGQAVLCCKDVVKEPFVIINADDYYGKEAFVKLHDFLVSGEDLGREFTMGMGGFILKNTLSDNGTVTRGVSVVDENGLLSQVHETTGIVMGEDGQIKCDSEEVQEWISPEDKVSMNMWAGYPEFLDFLAEDFKDFLANVEEGDLKSEYLLPNIVDKLLKEERANVKVLETQDRWFGVTYKEDKETVQEAFRELIADGVYAEMLWE